MVQFVICSNQTTTLAAQIQMKSHAFKSNCFHDLKPNNDFALPITD